MHSVAEFHIRPKFHDDFTVDTSLLGGRVTLHLPVFKVLQPGGIAAVVQMLRCFVQ